MKNKLQFIAARPEYCPKPWGLGTCGLKTASKIALNTLGDGASLGAGHGCNTHKFFNLSGSQARQQAPRH